MKTLKIEIPKGFEIDNFDIKTGEIKFKETPKCIAERIKTLDDVLSANDITRQAFDKWCNGLEVDEINYRLVKLIVLALNEGWKPDWKDTSEYKYYPSFVMDNSSSGSRFS